MWMRVMHRDETLVLNSEDHEPANTSLARCAGGTSVKGCIGMHDLLDGQNQAKVLYEAGGTIPGCPHRLASDSAPKLSLS